MVGERHGMCESVLSPQVFTVYGTADADNTPFLIYPISLAQQTG
jgi:hypothetical protein